MTWQEQYDAKEAIRVEAEEKARTEYRAMTAANETIVKNSLQDGRVKIKKTNSTLNGRPIFEIWELTKGQLGGMEWHFWGNVSANTKFAAYSQYLNE